MNAPAEAEQTDHELLLAHVDGDPDAFAILFRRHRDRLWAVALRTMGNPDDAADGLQDGMIAAYRRAGSFRGDAAVTTWLHRVVVNACLDRLRAMKVRRADPLPEDLDDVGDRGSLATSTREVADPADLAVVDERRRMVLAALDQLPPDQKAALILVDMEGYPVAEVAQMLDCAVGTVKSRCSRGRSRLANLLGVLRPGVTRDTPGHGTRTRPRPSDPRMRPAHRRIQADPRPATQLLTSRGGVRPMSDQPADDSLPGLSPEQESEVRRLLADARYDEPIPADVGGRLDAVLSGLTRDEPGAEGVAPVIDLAARRRRRNAAAMLAGAAAVIVAGFGIGQVIDVGGATSDDASSAGSAADRAAGAEDAEDGAELPQAAGSGGPTLASSAPAVPNPLDGLEAPLRLRSAHLASDITQQLRSHSYDLSSVRAPDAKAFSAAGCPLPASPSRKFGLGDLYPALFDDAPAVLAVRPANGSTRDADVLDCSTADSLASVTLPAR